MTDYTSNNELIELYANKIKELVDKKPVGWLPLLKLNCTLCRDYAVREMINEDMKNGKVF